MISLLQIKERIKKDIYKYMNEKNDEYSFIPGKTWIHLSEPAYGPEEVWSALESMLEEKVTMGKKVAKFENMFADYVGIKHGIMVNSGSSANLLALSILTNPTVKKRVNPGDEIIVPALTWSTSIYPIINVGAKPVLVDSTIGSYNIDPEKIESAITKKTKAIMIVHLLGNPCEMNEIIEIANNHNLYIIEDSCEAHGAEYKNKKVGSFGDISTYSFFFSHHITTLEGGMVLTNNDEFAELSRTLRAHGWVRDLKHKETIIKKYPNIPEKYLFINIGYNIRPTEIQGAFGINQIKKLDHFVEIRRKNAEYWTKKLKQYEEYFILPNERKGTKHSWFGYPLTIRKGSPFSRKDLMKWLEINKIENRPLVAGNMAEQPAMKLFPHKVPENLKVAKYVMKNSMYFGNHHKIGREERRYIFEKIAEFIENKGWQNE